MDVREYAKQESVASHGVQDPRQREHRSDETVKQIKGLAVKIVLVKKKKSRPQNERNGTVPGEQCKYGSGGNDPFYGYPTEMVVHVRERCVGVLCKTTRVSYGSLLFTE